jgi:hypothetical protein
MLKKAYMDFRDTCGDPQSVAVSSWDSDMIKATYTDGIVNDPNGTGQSNNSAYYLLNQQPRQLDEVSKYQHIPFSSIMPL